MTPPRIYGTMIISRMATNTTQPPSYQGVTGGGTTGWTWASNGINDEDQSMECIPD